LRSVHRPHMFVALALVLGLVLSYFVDIDIAVGDATALNLEVCRSTLADQEALVKALTVKHRADQRYYLDLYHTTVAGVSHYAESVDYTLTKKKCGKELIYWQWRNETMEKWCKRRLINCKLPLVLPDERDLEKEWEDNNEAAAD
jgi:hypothetical protein